MSRSGYTDDCENLGLWRASVDRAIRGRRGQAFLREMAAALDAMPVRELIANDIMVSNDRVCAIGAVALARQIDASKLDAGDGEAVASKFGIARALACEIAYENDECGFAWVNGSRVLETPAERWARMRAWVAANLAASTPDGDRTANSTRAS